MSTWTERAAALAVVALVATGCTAEQEAPTTPAPEATPAPLAEPEMRTFEVPAGSGPHDVAPAADGTVWYTAQRGAALGLLDPADGSTQHIALGPGARPHGVIVGPDDAAWVTDGGLNAIVRVDADTHDVSTFRLPEENADANLNTATFDGRGVLWFTGQAGIYGSFDPSTEAMEVYDAPGGRGPYGIATTPDGEVYYASLAGNHIARIDTSTGQATRIDPPTPGQGARRVWSDSAGAIWVAEWNAGKVGRYDPSDGSWQEWDVPGDNPMPYAVFVDERDVVWLSDFGANAFQRFDPADESFTTIAHDRPSANVRQILGRPGEVWGAESGTDRLVLLRTAQ